MCQPYHPRTAASRADLHTLGESYVLAITRRQEACRLILTKSASASSLGGSLHLMLTFIQSEDSFLESHASKILLLDSRSPEAAWAVPWAQLRRA